MYIVANINFKSSTFKSILRKSFSSPYIGRTRLSHRSTAKACINVTERDHRAVQSKRRVTLKVRTNINDRVKVHFYCTLMSVSAFRDIIFFDMSCFTINCFSAIMLLDKTWLIDFNYIVNVKNWFLFRNFLSCETSLYNNVDPLCAKSWFSLLVNVVHKPGACYAMNKHQMPRL